jgi:serralysin
VRDADFKGKDKLDLSPIDPIAGGVDDAFKWRGTKDFTGNGPEVMYDKKGSKVILFGDATGDGKADFAFQFNGLSKLDKGDLIL